MVTSYRISCTSVLCVLMVSSIPVGAQSLEESDRQALMRLQEESRRALLDGDAAAAAALFEEEAVLMPPGAPAVEGRKAIEAFWRQGPTVTRFEIRVLEVEGEGQFAYVRGTYVLSFDGHPLDQEGKFLQVLRRQREGHWLIRADMFGPDTR